MYTMNRSAAAVACAILAGTLAACAPYPQQRPVYQQYQQAPAYSQPQASYPAYQQSPMGTEYGRIANIEAMQVPSGGQTTGGGAVLGAVVGGLLGNQIGRGGGRAAATAAGVIGGAVAGNAIEGRGNQGYAQAYRITIQLDQGGMRAYDVSSPGDLRIGERVRMYNGQISRM